MKKTLLYIPLVLVMILFASCKKEDAAKDVENAINKLIVFNNTFDELYADGVISKEAPNEDEDSEYDKLKQIASQYYETMNKINRTVEEEAEDLKDGEVNEYEAEYKKVVEEKASEIEEATKKFEENLGKIE